MRYLKVIFFFFVFIACSEKSWSQRYITKKITFEVLKGTWKVKSSKDVKTFEENKPRFMSMDARCFLKSEWSFDSDSTGYLIVEESNKCEGIKLKFSFQLLESPGYGGPLYKMLTVFENGVKETLSLFSNDGIEGIELAYSQKMTNSDVLIYYKLKKKI